MGLKLQHQITTKNIAHRKRALFIMLAFISQNTYQYIIISLEKINLTHDPIL
jgi:hypothetical protein